MIYRRLFPADGGGSLRRLYRLKRDAFNNRQEALKAMKRMRPLTLFDFAQNEHDAADARNSNISGSKGGWRISDDETIGGYSGGTLTFVSSLEDLENRAKAAQAVADDGESSAENKLLSSEEYQDAETIADKDSTDSEEHASTLSTNSNSTFIPYLRFDGATDTTLPTTDGRIRRSGFVAIKSPEFFFGAANLGDSYNALEIKCRVDARSYTLNLKILSFFPDDLYQGYIRGHELPPLKKVDEDDGDGDNNEKEWRTLILPFQGFALTALGRMRQIQRKLDGNVDIEYLGITLADGVDGDFEFDLARIRAVNCIGGRVIEGDEADDDENFPSETEARMAEKRAKLAEKFRY
jgi:hypothetical protein